MVSSVLRDARRIVVKVGSSLVTNEGRGLDETAIGEWSRQLAALVRGDGGAPREVVMVSSGAIAEGMKRLGWTTRPQEVHELQAAAAVGQMGLVQVWESRFKEHGLHTAQVLLTHDDVARRDRYLNARSDPGVDNKIVGGFAKDTTVNVFEIRTVNGHRWGRTSSGWICLTYTTLKEVSGKTITDTGASAYAFTGSVNADVTVYTAPGDASAELSWPATLNLPDKAEPGPQG